MWCRRARCCPQPGVFVELESHTRLLFPAHFPAFRGSGRSAFWITSCRQHRLKDTLVRPRRSSSGSPARSFRADHSLCPEIILARWSHDCLLLAIQAWSRVAPPPGSLPWPQIQKRPWSVVCPGVLFHFSLQRVINSLLSLKVQGLVRINLLKNTDNLIFCHLLSSYDLL